MNQFKSRFSLIALACLLSIAGIAQYSDYKSFSARIDKLCTDYPSLCSSKQIVKTAGGRSVWVLTIGTGDTDSKPGIAVAGGVDGSYPAGRELSLGFATSLLEESSTPANRSLLEKITFYVFPDVNPDAAQQFFAPVKYERSLNAASTDDDRDFSTNEDPFEDLDGDGFITTVRIEDPSGQYIESDDDKRIMIPSDLSGRVGKYIVISEGTDNDHDGLFNEDGEGGVDFNRNFSYNYEEFGRKAGLHAMSEPESKAVADFLFDRFNIYAVFTFGPQDNLGQPFRSADNPRVDRRIVSILKNDEAVNKLVSEKYHEITGLIGSPPSKAIPGNFTEWAYYHYGRFSFGTPGWWFPAEKGKNTAAEFLKYAEKNKLDVFVPWKEISHPDFPGKKAEAGGLKPFVMVLPPPDSIRSVVQKNYKFIMAVAALHPELEFLDIKTENKGSDVYRISLKVHNSGVFPTMAEVGEVNNWTRIMRISLETTEGQAILSGNKVARVGRLEGGASATYSWLVQGKGQVKVTAGAVNTGIVSTTLPLK